MRAGLFFLLFLFAGAAPAGDSRISAADLAEIRAVIGRQIEAFRRDDAPGAFALAAPEVQRSFGTPERFLERVRASYRAVYRPSAVVFLDRVVMGADVVQQVRLVDRDGAAWLAYYAMQRQKDGSWRTRGCHLVPPARTVSASFVPQ